MHFLFLPMIQQYCDFMGQYLAGFTDTWNFTAQVLQMHALGNPSHKVCFKTGTTNDKQMHKFNCE